MPRRTLRTLISLGSIAGPVLGVASCASTAAPPPTDVSLDPEVVAAELDVDLSTVANPRQLTPEMTVWLEQKVPAGASPSEQVDRLLEELFAAPHGLLTTYDPVSSGSAVDVFDRRIYNCLSFSHLFVGLTRELGIDSYYILVDRTGNYAKEGDLVLATGHVTAGFRRGTEGWVVELAATEGTIDFDRGRPISDRLATALFYANEGAVHILEHEAQSALRSFSTAAAIAPELSDNWLNLGVARRRLGSMRGAEEAYRRAIAVDPRSVSAYFNLYNLLVVLGKRDAAKEVLGLLHDLEIDSPYVFLTLGDASRSAERYDEARRFYRRALRLDAAKTESLAALGLVALDTGHARTAEKWRRRAERGDERGREIRYTELRRRLLGG